MPLNCTLKKYKLGRGCKKWYILLCIFWKKSLASNPLLSCAQLCLSTCLALCSPVDYNLPGSSVQRIFQARILDRVAISYSKGSLKSPALATRFFTTITTLTLSSVQSLSCVWLFATPWIAAHQASLSITNSRSLLKLMSIESVMPSSRLILCRPLLLLRPIPPSIRVFSNKSTLHMRWPKY